MIDSNNFEHDKIKKHAALCLFLSCMMALLFQNCIQVNHQQKNTFHINYSGGTLESLDPAFAKDLYMIWTTHMVYNTLVETDDNLHIVPSLAKSWDISADGMTYTFHLRDDVFFHDNKAFPQGKERKMTAQDVVYSFTRLTDPGTAANGAWIFHGHIDEKTPFTAIDDTTVQLHLSAPFRPMLGMLSMAYCSIVPHEAVAYWGKDFRNHPCGTGPFMMSYWDEGNSLCLLKNKNYWETDRAGERLPYLNAVQVSFTDSKATEFLLFRQGRLDFVNGIDGSFKDIVLSKNGELKPEFQSKFKLDKRTYLNTEYIGFLTDTMNPVMKDAPTRNRLVRQAMNYATNRQKIATYFKNGTVIPATCGFIPAGMPGYDSKAGYGYHYDPEKAQQLLALAGHPHGQGLKPLKILVQDNYVDIVNFVASELQEAGIPVEIEVMQPNILKQQMSRSQAVCFRAQWIADYPDAETYLVVFNSHEPAPPNYTRFKNDTFDAWYNHSLDLPDSARWQLYAKMDSLAMSYAPLMPLYYEELLHFTQNNIEGLGSNAMNLVDLKRVRKK